VRNLTRDGDRPALVNAGTASVLVEAVDPAARLVCTITVELAAGGLVRAQAELTNLAPEPYQLEDCVLAFPVPQDAREILDLAGRWGKERVPQRRRLGVGVHLREGRKGRTGPEAATLLHLGTPGSDSRPARSGRCTPVGAATTPTTPSGCPPASR
jgi:alpha-galactosidase